MFSKKKKTREEIKNFIVKIQSENRENRENRAIGNAFFFHPDISIGCLDISNYYSTYSRCLKQYKDNEWERESMTCIFPGNVYYVLQKLHAVFFQELRLLFVWSWDRSMGGAREVGIRNRRIERD